MMPLQKEDIALKRLVSQQIAVPKFEQPEQVVAWMGAMQAQDLKERVKSALKLYGAYLGREVLWVGGVIHEL